MVILENELRGREMVIESIPKINVVDKVYEQMKENIISGEWGPDDQIPSENELCGLFGVSRNTVRSAIQKLKTIGVLITKQGQGTFVCKVFNEQIIERIIPIIYLSKNDIIEVLEFRKVIEIESIGLAAVRRTEEDINNMESYLNMMLSLKDNFKEFSIYDYQFHLSIAKASKNRIFYWIMLQLRDVIYAHFEEMCKDLGTELSVDDHKMILAAITDKDPELAKFLLKQMLENISNQLKFKFNCNNRSAI